MKLVTTLSALALSTLMAIPAPATAQQFSVQFSTQDRYIANQCDVHPNWRGCDDWRRNHHRWHRDDYARWYGWNRVGLPGVAAGIFGLAVGAAVASSINDRNGRVIIDEDEDHIAACEDRYRSYNARTDMFLGYDGDYHRCLL